MSYLYSFIGGKSNSYIFETALNIVYEIKFKPSSYVKIFDDEVSEFITEISKN